MTIVGIVKDMRTRGPDRPVQAELFMPYEQHQGPATSLNIVMRTDAADPLALGATAARQIRGRNPEVPVRVETMEMTMANATATPRFRTVLLVVFAVVALLLAIAGVYGVMAYTVNQRVPEIGLRVALGASPSDVMRLVLREGAMLVVIGLGGRRRAVVRRRAIHQRVAVRRVGARSAGVRCGVGAGGDCGAGGVPDSRPARAARRSAAGAARGVTTSTETRNTEALQSFRKTNGSVLPCFRASRMIVSRQSASSRHSGRTSAAGRVPAMLPANAATSHSQPCRLPEAMPLK